MFDERTRTGERASVGDDRGSRRARLGCAVPASSLADTAVKRGVDRVLRVADTGGGWPLIATLAVLLGVAGQLPGRGRLIVELLAFVLGAGYCLANFWRCREAHCVVSGIGWSGLAALTAAEVVAGRSLVGGYESLVFLVVLALAYLFELTWSAVTGSKVLRRTPR